MEKGEKRTALFLTVISTVFKSNPKISDSDKRKMRNPVTVRTVAIKIAEEIFAQSRNDLLTGLIESIFMEPENSVPTEVAAIIEDKSTMSIPK